MTSTEPMTYKPGPELDRCVGEALGWTCTHPHCDGNKRTVCIMCGTPGHGNCSGRGFRPVDVPCHHRPKYSTEWEGMRLVVEEMQRRGWEWAMWQDGSIYNAEFSSLGDGRGVVSRYADTAPHAVCLAALSTLQHVSHTDGLGDRDD